MSVTISITMSQAQVILAAPVTGSYGSAERLHLKEDIQKAFAVPVEQAEIQVSKDELKAWAAGCIDGWGQQTFASQAGIVPMADGHRNLLRLSAKSLRVWGAVKKSIPKV